MTDRWRLFVAVPIGEQLRRDLADAAVRWRARADLQGLRWTDPADWHLTLAFLGATDPAALRRLTEALEVVATTHEPVELPTGGVGAFPSARRARVAWYGVGDPEGRLARLADAVRRAVGVDAATSFRAHLTLGRARRDPIDLRPWLQDAEPPVGRLAVEGVQLMRSHLGHGPARYEVVSSHALGAAARV